MVELPFSNRREYFRLSFAELSATMNIMEVAQRTITTTPKMVRILDAGGGGLCVGGEDDLPIRRGIVARFEFGIQAYTFSFQGLFVWKLDDRVIYQYGIRFLGVDEPQRNLLLSVLGRIQVERNSKARV